MPLKIVFDTETTGLPIMLEWDKYHDPSDTEKYQDSRLVQLGYILSNEDGEIVKTKSHIIKPEDFTITNERFHGISNSKALKEGETLKTVLEEFGTLLKKCDTLIAHNINFDLHILLSECYRLGLNDIISNIREIEKFCTMKEGQKITCTYKSPKLIQLYHFLYPEETWKQTHNALDDAHICLKCYKKLV